MSAELEDPTHTRSEIRLSSEEERLLKQAVISAEPINVWSLLMPTVYQLVPGSLIARLWYNSIFPPNLLKGEKTFMLDANGTQTDFSYVKQEADAGAESVFSALMVVATSLALGLLLGMGITSLLAAFFRRTVCAIFNSGDSMTESTKLLNTGLRDNRDDRQGLMNTPEDEDPDSGELFPERRDTEVEQSQPNKAEDAKDEENVSNASA